MVTAPRTRPLAAYKKEDAMSHLQRSPRGAFSVASECRGRGELRTRDAGQFGS
jgi:hypothetical protein